MAMIYRAAAAVGLGLELVQQATGQHLVNVPELTSPLAQLGVVFGATFITMELVELVATFGRWTAGKVKAVKAASARGRRKPRQAGKAAVTGAGPVLPAPGSDAGQAGGPVREELSR